jgi:hypothetical protein
MLRNWVTQFGFSPGSRAGDERISEIDRNKFISQIGAYFGWNPPPKSNWTVEVTVAKDNDDLEDKYVLTFMRYTTKEEVDKMLGKNYEKYKSE